jgi:hypothetical protein
MNNIPIEETPTDKKIGEIYADLTHPEAYIHIIMTDNCYQFDPENFIKMLQEHCMKSIKTDDVGVALILDNEDDEQWQRWQNRNDLK